MSEHDVIIIGSGAAGLTAALTLAETKKVAVLAKGNLVKKVINLAVKRSYFDHWIKKPGRSNNKFYRCPAGFLILGRSCRDKNSLIHDTFKFGEIHRPVVESRREPEAVLNQYSFSAYVGIVHPSKLRNGHM